MWVLYAFCSALFAGITSILAKIGIKDVNSTLATAIRTIIVLIFSWLMVVLVGSQYSICDISIKSLSFLILSGMATGFSWLCYFKALQIGDVNKVVPIDKCSNVLTIIFAFIILGESITSIKLIAIISIFIGTFMMIEKKLEQKKKTGNKYIVFAIGSAVFASLTSILAKIGVENVESNLAIAIRTIVVLLMSWIIVFIQNKHNDIKKIKVKSWCFIVLSGITTGVSWICYFKALSEGQASIVAPIDKLSLLISVCFAYLVLKEKLTKRAVVGLIILTLGTLILLIKY